MLTLLAFFRLIRTGNLLIMASTLTMSHYCLSATGAASHTNQLQFALLVLATCMVAAGGYIINDYFDVKLDMVNKPGAVIIGNLFTRRTALSLHLLLNLLGIILGFSINRAIGMAVILCAILLLFYSTWFKKQFLTGNILVAGMSAFVVVIIKLFNPSISWMPVIAYAFFAFMISLMREIIKDAEDMKGDSKYDCRTIPIVLGIRKTRTLLHYLNIAMMALLLVFISVFSSQLPFNNLQMFPFWIGWMLIAVLIPQVLVTVKLQRADIRDDFSRLSRLCKWIMLTGMLSMIWFKL